MKPNTVGRAGGQTAAEPIADIKPGLAQGTIVLTLDGELPVEYLMPGDRIITRDSGMAVLQHIRMRKLARAPYRILPGTLGHDRPDAEMLVSPDQEILVRDWRARALFGRDQALVPVTRLADGEFIAQTEAPQETRVFELVFNTAHIIYANGIEVAASCLATMPADFEIEAAIA